jgi:hypothetical protein
VKTAGLIAAGQNGFHDGCELAERMHWSNAHGHWVFTALTAFGMIGPKAED